MVAPTSQPPLLALVDELLAEQGRLQTPVVRAAEARDRNHDGRFNSRRHADLIPLTAPLPGEQYAFEVDLDACSGCKSCVVACHALNGLDPAESWRDVGLVTAHAYQQTITSACHHCADPGCLNGCPVLAYEKDPLTGIVRHLDDQCIGCQYCVLKCPYDVPKYNDRLGIVRKCDMCHQRLAVSEAPACVQACPTHAIKIVKVSVSTPERRADTAHFLTAAPDPAYTQPTTRYLSRRPLPADAHAADATVLRPQPPHWPLVFMLTLVAWAVMQQVVALTPLARPAPVWLAWLPLGLGAAGLGAATLHLGQPLRAWRVFLGLRQSWFSREAVLFGAWFAVTSLAAVLSLTETPNVVTYYVANFAALLGSAGLLCSVMIYVDTRRRFWRAAQTAPRFLGGGLVLALAAVQAPGAAGLLAAKLAFEASVLVGRETTARLHRRPLRRATCLRFALGLIALALLLLPGPEFVTHCIALAALLLGELAERYLFFRAVDAPKMPGQPAPTTRNLA